MDFITAIKQGDASKVRDFIKSGLDVNMKTSSGVISDPILIYAISMGFSEIARLLIQAGAKVDKKGCEGVTALMSAAIEGNVEIVNLLLGAGAKVNTKDKDRYTALIFASQGGHLDVVLSLIDAGADIYQKNKDGRTATECAVINNHHEVVKVLLQTGGITSKQDAQNVLRWANQKGDSIMIEVLRQSGFQDILLSDADIQTLNQKLIDMAKQGSVVGVLSLIRAGAVVNTIDNDGNTPLIWAVRLGHERVVHSLISCNADFNLRNYQNKNALTYAVELSNSDVIDVLLKAGF
jgi:serine/threonine-protein phosphatase 6 regulatory ankyrin repeat subunit B